MSELPEDLQTAIRRAADITTRLQLAGRDEVVVAAATSDSRIEFRLHKRGPIVNHLRDIDAFEQTLKNAQPINKDRPSREERRRPLAGPHPSARRGR